VPTQFFPSAGVAVPDPRDLDSPMDAELARDAANSAQRAAHSGRGRPRGIRNSTKIASQSIAGKMQQIPVSDPIAVDISQLTLGGSASASSASGIPNGSMDGAPIAAAGPSKQGVVSLHPPPIQPSAPYPFLRLGGAALLPYSVA